MLDDLKHILESKGIIPSFHRIKIYEYLMNNTAHPTADTIYNDMIRQIPTLSKTTIYNTLKTFVKNGLLNSVTIEDNEVRFDPDIGFHGHFKCLQCGSLHDIQFNEQLRETINVLVTSQMRGYSLMESHFYLKGICKNCLS